MTYYIGCDPGSNANMAVACIDDAGRLVFSCTAEESDEEIQERAVTMPHKLRAALPYNMMDPQHPKVLVMEWQRPLKTDRRPADICNLAVFSGIALTVLQDFYHPDKVRLPEPQEWKGQVKKEIHHPRILARLHPDDQKLLAKMTKAKRGNILDAIGMALWAREKGRLNALIARALS